MQERGRIERDQSVVQLGHRGGVRTPSERPEQPPELSKIDKHSIVVLLSATVPEAFLQRSMLTSRIILLSVDLLLVKSGRGGYCRRF